MAGDYECRLEVSGKPATVAMFVAHFGDADFSLHSFLPAPEGGATKASWLATRWGIAHDIECTGGFRIEDGRAVKDFTVLGGLPLTAFALLSQQFPFLEFALFFIDPVWQIAGLVRLEEGEVFRSRRTGFEHYDEIKPLSPWHRERAEKHQADDSEA
jgi:hypothetical protein